MKHNIIQKETRIRLTTGLTFFGLLMASQMVASANTPVLPGNGGLDGQPVTVSTFGGNTAGNAVSDEKNGSYATSYEPLTGTKANLQISWVPSANESSSSLTEVPSYEIMPNSNGSGPTLDMTPIIQFAPTSATSGIASASASVDPAKSLNVWANFTSESGYGSAKPAYEQKSASVVTSMTHSQSNSEQVVLPSSGAQITSQSSMPVSTTMSVASDKPLTYSHKTMVSSTSKPAYEQKSASAVTSSATSQPSNFHSIIQSSEAKAPVSGAQVKSKSLTPVLSPVPDKKSTSIQKIIGPSTSKPETPVLGLTIKVDINNLPEGLFFKTGSNFETVTEVLINGIRYQLPQTLDANTTWRIYQIGHDENGTTWYNIGNNHWVCTDDLTILAKQNSYSGTPLLDVKPVLNTSVNLPVTLAKPFVFKLDPKQQYEVWNSYLDSHKDYFGFYQGKLSFEISTIAVSSTNLTWLEVQPGFWIRSSGYDYEDLDGLTKDTQLPNQSKTALLKMARNAPYAKDAATTISEATSQISSTLKGIFTGMIQGVNEANRGMQKMIASLGIENKTIYNRNGLINAMKGMIAGVDEANKGMQKMVAGLGTENKAIYNRNGMIDALNGMIAGVNEANTGMREENSALNGPNGLIATMNKVIGAIAIVNIGLSEANLGAQIAIQGEHEMIGAQAETIEGVRSFTKSIAGIPAAVDNALSHLSNDNSIDRSINPKSYLYNLHKNSPEAFQANKMAPDVLKDIKAGLVKTQNVIDSLDFLVGATVKVLGGTVLTIGSIVGVDGGYAIVETTTGGLASVGLPGVIALDGSLAALGSASVISGVSELQNGLNISQFHNGDRPTSHTTVTSVQGKYRGKTYSFRVDVEPDSNKIQIQINGAKGQAEGYDERIFNGENIRSFSDAMNAIPRSVKSNFTASNLRIIANGILRAAEFLSH